MKKFYRILSMILVLFTLFSFAGCGGCEHDFAPATCETAKKCVICNLTEGQPAEHVASEWQNKDNQIGREEIKKCLTCGEILETRDAVRGEKTKKVVLASDGFDMSMEEFAKYLIAFKTKLTSCNLIMFTFKKFYTRKIKKGEKFLLAHF